MFWLGEETLCVFEELLLSSGWDGVVLQVYKADISESGEEFLLLALAR